MNIRAKFTSALLLTSLIGILTVSAAVGYLSYHSLITARAQALSAIVMGQKTNVRHIVSAWVSNAALIASRTQFTRYMDARTREATDEGVTHMRRFMADALKSTVDVTVSITVCDLRGEPVLYVGPSDPNAPLCADFLDSSTREFGVRAMRRVADGLQSLTSGPVSLDDKVSGYIVVIMNADSIAELSENDNGLGVSGETVLAERQHNSDLAFWSHLRFEPMQGPQAEQHDGLNHPMTVALTGQEVLMTDADTVDYSGNPVLAATAYIPELGWGLVSKINRDEALEPIAVLMTSFLQVTAAVAAAVVLAGLYLAASISAPILHIAQVSKRVRDGDFQQKASVSSADEVGELAEAFNDMLETLNERSDELEEFSYRTSHDLRSPLRSALGLIAIVDKSVREGDPQSTQTAIDLAQKTLARLDALLNDITTLAKLKHEDEPDCEVMPEPLVRGAVAQLAHSEHVERVAFSYDWGFQGPLLCKEMRLRLIVENLISNAIKYQDLDKKEATVHVATAAVDGRFVLSVQDNGLGVPPELQGRLFGMFQRLHPKASFGSGLGLYMIRKSARRLGGDIEFEDVADGSVFRFILPLRQTLRAAEH